MPDSVKAFIVATAATTISATLIAIHTIYIPVGTAVMPIPVVLAGVVAGAFAAGMFVRAACSAIVEAISG